MKSRNIHSEIVFCLGFNNNIATTLNTFGISATTTDLLIIKIACPSLGLNPSLTAESVTDHLKEHVEAEMVEYSEERLKEMCNVERVRGIYKLGPAGGKGGKGRRRKDGNLEGLCGKREGVVGSSQMDLIGESDVTSGISEAREMKELEVQILGLMALRGAV